MWYIYRYVCLVIATRVRMSLPPVVAADIALLHSYQYTRSAMLYGAPTNGVLCTPCLSISFRQSLLLRPGMPGP